MQNRSLAILAALVALGSNSVALAQSPSSPPPPTPASTGAALPYLQIAGESDVYEVTSSMIAMERARNAQVRSFARMLIDHHTLTTNATLTAAKAAGLVPPPAVLGQGTRAQIDQLYAATPATFDQLFLTQQVSAHEQALAVQRSYATQGDKAPLRTAAQSAVPIINQHLEYARRLLTSR